MTDKGHKLPTWEKEPKGHCLYASDPEGSPYLELALQELGEFIHDEDNFRILQDIMSDEIYTVTEPIEDLEGALDTVMPVWDKRPQLDEVEPRSITFTNAHMEQAEYVIDILQRKMLDIINLEPGENPDIQERDKVLLSHLIERVASVHEAMQEIYTQHEITTEHLLTAREALKALTIEDRELINSMGKNSKYYTKKLAEILTDAETAFSNLDTPKQKLKEAIGPLCANAHRFAFLAENLDVFLGYHHRTLTDEQKESMRTRLSAFSDALEDLDKSLMQSPGRSR